MRTIEAQLVQIMKDFHNRKVTGACQRSKRDRIVAENGKVSAYLWGSKLAEYDGANLVLFSNSYRTVTTKSRLNAMLRGFGCKWRISQDNFVWYAYHYSGLQRAEFTEGMTFAA